MTIENYGPAPAQDTASVLFGMDGVEVTEAEREADGRLTVWGQVALPAVCPECGTVSEHAHQYMTASARDVRACGQDAGFCLVKRRMRCAQESCPRKTFTEWVPQVPPRCTITRRLLGHAGTEVADRGITPAEAGRDAGISWPSAHAAFKAKAGEILDEEPSRVAHLGIDEHRRGRPRWRKDTDTGQTVQLADRWHVCFYDLDGHQGLLGQVEGRTSDDAAYWLAGATPAWRDAVEVVAIDMCAIFASAVHRLNVIRIRIPPLRERPEDIPQLVRSFLAHAAEELKAEPKHLRADVLQRLKTFPWPGNVRQLENICRWLTVMAPGRDVHLQDLPPELQSLIAPPPLTVSAPVTVPVAAPPVAPIGAAPPRAAAPAFVVDNERSWSTYLHDWAQQELAVGHSGLLDTAVPLFERTMIEVALHATRGQRQEAAKRLGWGRNTLTRKIKELGMGDED